MPRGATRKRKDNKKKMENEQADAKNAVLHGVDMKNHSVVPERLRGVDCILNIAIKAKVIAHKRWVPTKKGDQTDLQCFALSDLCGSVVFHVSPIQEVGKSHVTKVSVEAKLMKGDWRCDCGTVEVAMLVPTLIAHTGKIKKSAERALGVQKGFDVDGWVDARIDDWVEHAADLLMGTPKPAANEKRRAKKTRSKQKQQSRASKSEDAKDATLEASAPACACSAATGKTCDSCADAEIISSVNAALGIG